MSDLHENLQALGSGNTLYSYDSPDADLLERFPTPHEPPVVGGGELTVHIVAPEFTSLCPKTGQPDFATIKVSYEPLAWCVESKSLKLYLGSFRMHGEFHEAVVRRIGVDLVRLLDPVWLRVDGEFTPRGGISFWPSFFWRNEGP